MAIPHKNQSLGHKRQTIGIIELRELIALYLRALVLLSAELHTVLHFLRSPGYPDGVPITTVGTPSRARSFCSSRW